MVDFKSILSETDHESGRSKIIGFKNENFKTPLFSVILLTKNRDRIILAQYGSFFTGNRSVCWSSNYCDYFEIKSKFMTKITCAMSKLS